MIAPTTGTIGNTAALPRSLFDTVLVKVAARCNLACSYCYFFFSEDQRWREQPAQMSPQVFEALARNLADVLRAQNHGFPVVLHGGEPLLLGEKKLRASLQILRDALPAQKIPISIQTNGVLITDSLLDLCSEFRVTISVSIDGPRQVHDVFRLTHGGQTVQAITRLREHRDAAYLFSGTLSVINPAHPPEQVYAFLKELGSPKMDFLYRDGNHDRMPDGKSRLESTEFGDWLCRLWDVYQADPSPVPIRILDDLAKLILGARNQKEGVGAESFSIVIIDTDGSVSKNDTLKNSHAGADCFSKRWNVTTDRLADVARNPEFQEYVALQFPSSEVCQSCSYLRVCGGGMPLYRWRSATGYRNPSVYCHDHQTLISHLSTSLWKSLTHSR
jgi:uncharacterized protein